jgi:hypothetical protein
MLTSWRFDIIYNRYSSTQTSQTSLLVVGPYALFLQALIGLVALSSLVYKRAVLDELPRRPFNIWFMDVSKQCFSSVLVHFFNIGISIMLSQVSIAESKRGSKTSDECANYLMNFVMGTSNRLLVH